jgi:hypothetical protein
MNYGAAEGAPLQNRYFVETRHSMQPDAAYFVWNWITWME